MKDDLVVALPVVEHVRDADDEVRRVTLDRQVLVRRLSGFG